MNFYLRSFLLIYMCIGIIISLVSICYIKLCRNKKMRILSTVQKASNTFYYREPPFSYSPVIITYLENLKLEIDKDIFAEILFLHNNGYIEINKVNKHQYILTKKQVESTKYDALLQSQKFILSSFNYGIDLKDFIILMYNYKDTLEKLYEDDCYELGYLKKFKDFFEYPTYPTIPTSLIKFILISFVFFIILLFFTLLFAFDLCLFLVKGFVFIVFQLVLNSFPSFALALLLNYIFSQTFLKRTKSAEDDYAKWLAFKAFLNDYTLIKNYTLDSVDIFEQYLTYSVALGVTKITIN